MPRQPSGLGELLAARHEANNDVDRLTAKLLRVAKQLDKARQRAKRAAKRVADYKTQKGLS